MTLSDLKISTDAPDLRQRAILAGILAAIVFGLIGCAADGPPRAPDLDDPFLSAHEIEVLQWRQRRHDRLSEPHGWLSLVGLEFLADGEYLVGTAPDNDIVVASGPSRWGTLQVVGREAWFVTAAGAAVRVDGRIVEEVELQPAGDDGAATLVEAGSVQMHLLSRGDGLALRVRDSAAPTLTRFAGLDYFPIDSSWRIEARWTEHTEARHLLIANVLGELINEPNPGLAEFERDGRTFGLEAVDAGDQLFFIFADRTSGRETYGLGRFLYADKPAPGATTVILDFNIAYNPPCAFTEFTTCPLPPPENRLDMRVEAGELTPGF
ncbi:MAG: DUF1684 domain-containing protein [Wenzhouxiangella sp.]|nr:MAG: DUF1684 domain-containing protein [Wenzhouxiangella sp.]